MLLIFKNAYHDSRFRRHRRDLQAVGVNHPLNIAGSKIHRRVDWPGWTARNSYCSYTTNYKEKTTIIHMLTASNHLASSQQHHRLFAVLRQVLRKPDRRVLFGTHNRAIGSTDLHTQVHTRS